MGFEFRMCYDKIDVDKLNKKLSNISGEITFSQKPSDNNKRVLSILFKTSEHIWQEDGALYFDEKEGILVLHTGTKTQRGSCITLITECAKELGYNIHFEEE